MGRFVIRVLGWLLFSVGAASARDVTLDFEELPSDTRAAPERYLEKGLQFDITHWLPFGMKVATGSTSSGTGAAGIGCGTACSTEFWVSDVRGIFVSNTQNSVTVNVGLVGSGGLQPQQPATVLLVVYDAQGRGLAKSVAQVRSGDGIKTRLQVRARNIASFTITGRVNYDTNKMIAIDDLTFSSPDTPSPPDFTVSAAPQVVTVLNGRSTQVNLVLNRLNGSSGDIALSLGTLPPGISAAFDSTSAGGSTATLTLSAAIDAPSNSAAVPISIAAAPASASVGSGTRSASVLLNVRANFRVLPVQAFSVAPAALVGCARYTLGLRIVRDFGFSGVVTLQAVQLPAGVHATFKNAQIDFSSGNAEVDSEVTFSVDPGTVFPAVDIASGSAPRIVASTPGFPDSSLAIPLSAAPSTISGFSPAVASTPQDLKRGTEVTVLGQGFCPGAFVSFGAGPDYRFGRTQPHFVSDDGRQMKVYLPRLAMSGPISLSPSADPAIDDTARSTDSLTVLSYRNQKAYSFHNLHDIEVTFDDVDELFGDDQTHLAIDFCWPFGCSVTTPIPSPLAAIFTGIARGALSDGQCFGMSLSSQRLLHGVQPMSAFLPVGAANLFELTGPRPSLPTNTNLTDGAALVHYVHVQHIAQLSSEYLHHWIGQAALNVSQTSGHIRAQISEALAVGDHPLVSLRNGSKGHVVVAMNIEEDGLGTGFYVDLYDPNFEFANEFATNPPAPHRYREGFFDAAEPREFGSRLHVYADGHWLLPHANYGTPWTGSLDTLVVARSSVVPVVPTMPASFEGLITLIFGDASGTGQITDSAGRRLLDPKGEVIRSTSLPVPPVTRFAALSDDDEQSTDIYILRPGGQYTQTVRGAANGPYVNASISSAGMSRVVSTTQPGASDDIVRSSRIAGITFRSRGTPKEFTAELAAQTTDGTQRRLTLTTMSSSAGDEVAFDASRDKVSFVHRGPAASYRFTLESAGKQAPPSSVMSAALRVNPGDRINIAPEDWFALASRPIMVTTASTDGRWRTQRLPVPPTLADLKIERVWNQEATEGNRLNAQLALAPAAAPEDLLYLAWNVMKGGRSVQHYVQQIPVKQLGSGSRTETLLVTREVRGSVSVNVSATLIHPGAPLRSETARIVENLELR